MSRTVIVHHYTTPTGAPDEFGRVWLAADGSIRVRGFPAHMRQKYETQGIIDWQHGEEVVPPTDGNRFLDVLLVEHSGTYVRAEEVKNTIAGITTLTPSARRRRRPPL
jgi:hypothetical protein